MGRESFRIVRTPHGKEKLLPGQVRNPTILKEPCRNFRLRKCKIPFVRSTPVCRGIVLNGTAFLNATDNLRIPEGSHRSDLPMSGVRSRFQPLTGVTFAVRSLLIAGLLSVSAFSSVFAEEKRETETQGPNIPEKELVELPAAFSQLLPASVEDLRVIQNHVTQIVPRLSECTVSLKIGRAQGSGVIVSPDGLILSAAHVSGPPGNTVSIITADGKQHTGTTLGRNTIVDGSMIRIDSDRKDWPFCPVAKEPANPGDWCATLGHPGGYQRDRGLVLRLGRVIERNNWIIQSDCELIGGDSGGPLFNMRGEVIGINTRIGESTQYNFHVPATAFVRDWERLVASEDFKTHSGAYLGVNVLPTDSGKGLRIEHVEPRTPADRVGLKVGDILLTFQGVEVNDPEQLVTLVGEELPGRSVKLTLLRDGETLERTVRLGMNWSR